MKKASGSGTGRPVLGSFPAHDPNALRGTNFGTNATTGTPVYSAAGWMILILNNQEGHKAKALWNRYFLIGVLYGDDAFGFGTLPNAKVIRRVRILAQAVAQVIDIRSQ